MVIWGMRDWSYGRALKSLFCIEVLGCLGQNKWFDIVKMGWKQVGIGSRTGVLRGLRKIQTWN